MKRKTLLSWSSGKDSAWALHTLRSRADVDVVGLFCTVNAEFQRVAMHAVRVSLLREQAKNTGLPLYIIPIPYPCNNAAYEKAMRDFIAEIKRQGVECVAFGDLYLADVRRYREQRLEGTGITPLFPLWGMPTKGLAAAMVDGGLKAVITCVDPNCLHESFAGREYNEAFIAALPPTVDPCGENGEFHSFAFDGPMFDDPVEVTVGDIVSRDGFVYADLMPAVGGDEPHSGRSRYGGIG